MLRNEADLRCRGLVLRNPDEGGAGPRAKLLALERRPQNNQGSANPQLVLLKGGVGVLVKLKGAYCWGKEEYRQNPW